MQALIVVDAQNEFSPGGLREVPEHGLAIGAIVRWVAHARDAGWPIVWVKHYNKPQESRAFVPGSWGAEISPELDPRAGTADEALFEKDVFGAFTYTRLEEWLRERQVAGVVIVGFFAHMCVSTSSREALIRGFDVSLDAAATAAVEVTHPMLGHQSAEEVRRSALLQLTHMGATIVSTPSSARQRADFASQAAPT